ncbi:uncharacterized protein RHIMIDRAFT_50665 [Rhizopus microsporus ATCC 52813]|uniref:Mediator of RNA polymerase II transcription subunit 11 n=1 Tax=Rhizopus microsporus ATCC 52813 TaxID=1340429 RepID=A0A2G4SKN1_RHIZD|nr:uncharacterized protein RHIMIDRAFT_50665 [Rhizopus microsporus ATCC 52813]PHZ09324.1 hypothetical protein RHIMIDRAFT_50665 [Rhizopus microsporus ATCC 52813]
MSNDQYVDPTQRMAESTMRIKDLYQVERKLVLLIETAGDALAILPEEEVKDENPDQFVRERALAFRQLASRYFSLVNDIQLALRSHVNYLTKTASFTPVANKTIPFKTSIVNQQKQLEIWAEAIKAIQQQIQEIKQIGQEQ